MSYEEINIYNIPMIKFCKHIVYFDLYHIRILLISINILF